MAPLEFKKIDTGFFMLYEFLADKSLAATCLQELKTCAKQGNKLNTTIFNQTGPNIPSNYWNKEAHDWFMSAINVVKDEMFIPELDMVITECWGNRTDRFQRHHQHSHPNSILSGVWYLTDSANVTTEFVFPNPWGFMNNFMPILKKDKAVITKSIVPEVGKLIIFPSNLMHSTSPNTTNDPRFSIAFNVFADGRFGPRSAQIEIKTRSLADNNK